LAANKENHWEGFPETYQAEGFQRLWRTHSDAVNEALLNRWWSEERLECSLKTDLFDEAVHDGLIPFLTLRTKKLFCVDASFQVHKMAKWRYPALQTVSADVRRLPFSDGTFDGIVSNSTLDHFESLDDITAALKELYRVLRPGGQMILTLDNLSNPMILLRNRLPFCILKQLRIVPYYIGITIRPSRLKHLLKDNGFMIVKVEALMHCPRLLAVAVARWMETRASLKMQNKFLILLMAFEKLSRLPTRFYTGYFTAVQCIKL
jgi:SAM-dependent methyltransferase